MLHDIAFSCNEEKKLFKHILCYTYTCTAELKKVGISKMKVWSTVHTTDTIKYVKWFHNTCVFSFDTTNIRIFFLSYWNYWIGFNWQSEVWSFPCFSSRRWTKFSRHKNIASTIWHCRNILILSERLFWKFILWVKILIGFPVITCLEK